MLTFLLKLKIAFPTNTIMDFWIYLIIVEPITLTTIFILEEDT